MIITAWFKICNILSKLSQEIENIICYDNYKASKILTNNTCEQTIRKKTMETRNSVSPKDVKFYTTERLREEFLLQNLFVRGEIKMVYSQIDRIITGAAVPIEPISLTAGAELRADYFLQRREMGVINIGGDGIIIADGKEYHLEHRDGMYLGLGTQQIEFRSKDAQTPAKFYFNSAPAHKAYPTVLIKL
ncbi:MAG: 5-dehydro-4-deoxy-D-glucuronate isomerase, partial [Herbinix sp.]|nr:5-dehydro-4-deoxy-D-glucuronate isomerase [Herbinix sp.]